MNYDAQQYAFSHGLATTPQQLQQQQQLQQHQLHQQQQHFQQQQQIFQQQYNQAVPTSNVYQFQFAGGGSPINPIFQQKDAHQMGIQGGGMQPRMAQHTMVPQSFLKQGVPMGIDGNSIHVVSSLDGMIYSQQKSSVKIIANPDGRIMQQPDGGVRMQQALVGVDMIGNSNFIEQSLDPQANQHQSIGVTGQGSMFTYNKQHFSGWLQPQQISSAGTSQRAAGCQSSLPSFHHVWSQFQHQKQVDMVQHQQHINQYQHPQQFQNQLHHQQQHMQNQPQFTAPSFQALPGIQMIKMQHQKPQQISVPVSMQPLTHLPQQLNCFSPSQPNLMSPNCIDKEVSNIDRGIINTDIVVPISSQPVHPVSGPQPLSSPCVEHQPTTAVTYTISGPPKVTVTLDSLTHGETFPPNKFPGRPDMSFNLNSTSPNIVKSKAVKFPNNLTPSVLSENCPPPHRNWQIHQHQRNTCLPKPLVHTSSTGSSLERSSSESSNFSSPPYTFTPPSSAESMFSPVLIQFSKVMPDNSSGRISALSSSSSSTMPVSSPPASSAALPKVDKSSNIGQPPINATVTSSATTAVATVSSAASSTCTTSVTSVVSSCNSMAITTTSVTCTIPSTRESTTIASVHSGLPLSSTNSSTCENHKLSCSSVRRPSKSATIQGGDRKVKVPYSWQRKLENGIIVYLSPSGVVLQSFDQICHYLLSDNTCKCGLECPIQVEKFFSFDPEVGSQPWNANAGGEDLGNLCNHRREILALAAFHRSQAEAAEKSGDPSAHLGKKRERKKSIGAGEGLIVAPLKRLKTSITNAVNKHAISASNITTTVDSGTHGDENSLLLNKESQCSNTRASVSPANSQSCSNHGDLSGQASPLDNSLQGTFDYQRTQFETDGNEKLLQGTGLVQNFTSGEDQEVNKQMFLARQPFQTSRGPQHENGGPQAFLPVGGNIMYRQCGGGDPVTGLQQNQYSVNLGTHNNQHQMQYSQADFPHHHLPQPPQTADANIYFQNHMYPSVSHMAQHRPQGFHSTIWQGGSPSGQPPNPQPHFHSPRQYLSGVGFQHSNYNHSQQGTFPKHSTPNQQQIGDSTWLDSSKAKLKRPKSKKDKQINSIVDRSSPCPKAVVKPAKAAAVLPSTTVSFFENPTVFVEQQTAIINNSIASCQIACSSPSPPQSASSKPVATYSSLKDTTFDSKDSKVLNNMDPIKNVSLAEIGKHEVVDREDDEDQKTGTDLDSNKSFSDTTENNDSAYLSQTGSDQERSDTIDGSDSCLETKSKSSDIYDFNSSEEKEIKPCEDLIHITVKSSEPNSSVAILVASKNPLPSILSPGQRDILVPGKNSGPGTKSQEKKSFKSKPRSKPTVVRKEVVIQDVELFKKNFPSNLNGDLSQLLASNNWNIPALQQVLAQYSGGDPSQLNAAIQQVHSQASIAGIDFPASNLLSAAARAQLNVKQKDPVVNSLLSNGLTTPMLQSIKSEAISTVNMGSMSYSDIKPAIVSTAVCGTIVSSGVSQHHHPQPSFQQISNSANVIGGNNTNVIGNMMQFQQLPSGSFAMNMLLPANGQGQAYASDSVHSGTFSTESDIKTAVAGQGTVNPLVAQSILATVSQPPDLGSQLKLSVASVISSGLGSNVAQCSADGSTMLLNNFGPRMIMNTPMPPVSVSVVTNVTKSLAQVVPAIGINQTVFGTQQVTPQLLTAQQNGPQIINAAAPHGTHVINTSPQGAQLVNTGPQGTQFVNPAAQGTQIVNSNPQATQIMNALSVQGLNNQLLITNPIQQVSPSNSISQLSPAMAAQILAQGHQLQQMSPSFLQNQVQKQAQNSLISAPNIFASVSLPTLTVTSGSTDAISSSISQPGIINNSIQKTQRTGEPLEKVDIASSLSQVKDTNSSVASASVYTATSQPVFVIPQSNTNPMMQVLGSAQPLNTASGLSADLNVQQGNLSQLFGQLATIDQTQLQNIFAGFNPLAVQQMMNAVNLSGVQQQQQQLQMLQLQQIMLQQLQGHGQNIHGISLPLNPSSSPSQATAIGAQTIMSAVMPQQGLQLNSVMDMNSLHPCLSPVAQGYQNQLSPAAAQLQHISSSLTVHQVAPVNTCGAVSVIQNGSIQNLIQATATKRLPAGASVQSQHIPADQIIHASQTPAVNPQGAAPHESPKATTAAPGQSSISASKSPSVNNGVKATQPNKSKSKSKSKKSESKKIVDPEAERNEEDIAATVQQILAQAVQQQRELSLAAKNQPPPPPKSKSKKSQARAKASQAPKEHDLGKLASISDDVPISKSDSFVIKDKPVFAASFKCSNPVETPSCFIPVVPKSSQNEMRQSAAISPSTNHIKFPAPTGTPLPSQPFNGLGTSSPVASSFVEQTLSETTNLVNSNGKKSAISLKDHLSSIISKDKDGGKKMSFGVVGLKQGKAKAGAELKLNCGTQSVPLINGEVQVQPKNQRKSLK